MPKSIQRVYSRYCRDAVSFLGGLIREARIKQKISTQELSDRAGISRGLLQRIEKGNPKCEIGVVFELAAITGVRLFDLTDTELKQSLSQINEKLVLLPKSIRRHSMKVDDDF